MLQLNFRSLLLTCLVIVLMVSCKKDPGGGTAPKKPKVGTIWTYFYYTYFSNGDLASSGRVTYRATGEQTLGGETWLVIKDVARDTLVYYLKEKSDGIYQYINSSSNIYIKSPATLNETYSTFNRGTIENFTVKGVNTLLPTTIGEVYVNYYEGFTGTDPRDQIWFNTDAWIVRHIGFKKPVLGPYYKYSALFIESIVY